MMHDIQLLVNGRNVTANVELASSSSTCSASNSASPARTSAVTRPTVAPAPCC